MSFPFSMDVSIRFNTYVKLKMPCAKVTCSLDSSGKHYVVQDGLKQLTLSTKSNVDFGVLCLFYNERVYVHKYVNSWLDVEKAIDYFMEFNEATAAECDRRQLPHLFGTV
jgi:hypothetical protein